MTRNSKSAEQQFADLGLTARDYTPAMVLAIKQHWSNLQIDAKVDDLRAAIKAVTTEETATADILIAKGMPEDEARSEAARLRRNAGVQAWRQRNQLQAALDAREAKFAKMRGGKGGRKSHAQKQPVHANVA